MKHQGLTIFVLFFSLSLLEAMQGKHWITAAIWLSLGFLFAAMDRPRRNQDTTAKSSGRTPSP